MKKAGRPFSPEGTILKKIFTVSLDPVELETIKMLEEEFNLSSFVRKAIRNRINEIKSEEQ